MKSLKYVDFSCETYHLKTQDTHYLFMCLIPGSSWTWKRTQGSHPAELPTCNSMHRCWLPSLPVTGVHPVFLSSTHPGLLISGATLTMLNPAPIQQTAFQTRPQLPWLALLQVKNSFLPQPVLRWCCFEIFLHPDLQPSSTFLPFLIYSEGLKTENILSPALHPQHWHRIYFYLSPPGLYTSVDMVSMWCL